MTVVITPYRFSDTVPDFFPDSGLTESLPEFDGMISVAGEEILLGFKVVVDRLGEIQCGEVFFRPRDFEQARNWVLDTQVIGKKDKHALLDLLNSLEEDDTLYLHLTC